MLTAKQQIIVLLEEVAANMVQQRVSSGAALRTINWAIRGVRQLPEASDEPKFYESKFELKWSQCWRAKVETLKRQVTVSQEALDAKIDECNKLAADKSSLLNENERLRGVVARLQEKLRAAWQGATAADVDESSSLRAEIERLNFALQIRTDQRDGARLDCKNLREAHAASEKYLAAERDAARDKGTELFNELSKCKKTLALLGQTLKDIEQ